MERPGSSDFASASACERAEHGGANFPQLVREVLGDHHFVFDNKNLLAREGCHDTSPSVWDVKGKRGRGRRVPYGLQQGALAPGIVGLSFCDGTQAMRQVDKIAIRHFATVLQRLGR